MIKQASHLKRGDFTKLNGREAIVLQDARPCSNPMLCEVLVTRPCNGTTGNVSLGPNDEVEVELSPLTVEQTHAGELMAHLNELVAYCLAFRIVSSSSWDAIVASAKRGRVLLDAIRPPAPVSEAELLAALVGMPTVMETVKPECAKRIADILDRAYRSGQLKRPGGHHDGDNQA